MRNESKELRRRWSESAHYWEKNRSFIERMFAPITNALIEKAEIRPGDHVLDLAGGIGEPSLSIAHTYGNGVMITFTDVVQQMILAARAEARNRGNGAIQFCRCSGDQLPFIDESFNVVVSRLGIMFFPDTDRALKEIMRVLKPSGRVSFAVWHKREFNPMYEIVANVLEEFIPASPEPIDAPGPFRFSEEGRLETLLKNAGFSSVKQAILDFQIQEAVGFEEFWKMRAEMSDTLRDKLIQLTPVQMNKLHQRLETEFIPYFVTGKLKIPARLIIVSGTKSEQR